MEPSELNSLIRWTTCFEIRPTKISKHIPKMTVEIYWGSNYFARFISYSVKKENPAIYQLLWKQINWLTNKQTKTQSKTKVNKQTKETAKGSYSPREKNNHSPQSE